MGGFADGVDRYFKVTERGSTIATEIRAGIITFLTMSYILLVNPQILGKAGLPVDSVVAATALSSTIASLICGLVANMPVGMSPGMGLNAYLVFSQVLGAGVSVHVALGGCFVAAIAVGVLAVIHALSLILSAVPDSIKLATVVGMGLLLTFIGLQTAGIVVPDAETLVTIGDLTSLEAMLAIGGLALTAALHYRNVKGAIILGILGSALTFFTVRGTWPTSFVALPHLKFWDLDLAPYFSTPTVGAYSAVLAYALVMIFDIGGAMFGLSSLAGLVKDGVVPGVTTVYVAGALATALGAYAGTTPLIVAAESAVGIKEGGRTGLVAITISACFAISMLLAPFLQSIPQVATAPVLVLVGAMMMGESNHIDWSNMLIAVPAFLTIVIQPFTFSIANGIYAGLIMSVLLAILTGTFITPLKTLLGFGPTPEEVNGFAVGDAEQPLLPGYDADLTTAAAAVPTSSPQPIHSTTHPSPSLQQRLASSLGGNQSYSRASFTMLTNTYHGSQRSGGTPHGAGFLGTHGSVGGTPRSHDSHH